MSINAAHIESVNQAMSEWQQGDAIVGDALSFLHLADLATPLTQPTLSEAEGGYSAGENLAVIAARGDGFVVISQTCDLVKNCKYRPFAQLAILQKVDPAALAEVEGMLRPNFAFIPGLKSKSLVANLDQIMTVEKSILASTPRQAVVRGVTTDDEIAAFSECLARKLSRFAFPDDFNIALAAIQEDIRRKHKKPNSKDGRAYRKLREIRASVFPSWSADDPNVEFLFVLKDPVEDKDALDEIFSTLLQKFRPTGAFRSTSYRIVSLLEVSADFYLGSQRLDLDYLSRSETI